MLLLQVHTLMQQSQAMSAQQLQAFAAQVQAVQAQGQLPGAAAPQQAVATGTQQPGAALMPQLPQMSGAIAKPCSPSPAQLPAAQPAAVMPALQQPAAGMPAFPGMLRGSGEQLAAPESSAPGRLLAVQVGLASQIALEHMHVGASLHHTQAPVVRPGHGGLCLVVRRCSAGMEQCSL